MYISPSAPKLKLKLKLRLTVEKTNSPHVPPGSLPGSSHSKVVHFSRLSPVVQGQWNSSPASGQMPLPDSQASKV